jgi:hypothetical protein
VHTHKHMQLACSIRQVAQHPHLLAPTSASSTRMKVAGQCEQHAGKQDQPMLTRGGILVSEAPQISYSSRHPARAHPRSSRNTPPLRPGWQLAQSLPLSWASANRPPIHVPFATCDRLCESTAGPGGRAPDVTAAAVIRKASSSLCHQLLVPRMRPAGRHCWPALWSAHQQALVGHVLVLLLQRPVCCLTVC